MPRIPSNECFESIRPDRFMIVMDQVGSGRGMRTVLLDAASHVVPSEPYGATASEAQSRCKRDLFVSAHAQHFVRLDERSRRNLLRACT